MSKAVIMDECIKRGAVIDLITRRYENPEICTQEINSIPAADVAPVAHGRWEWLGPNRLFTDCMCGTCSVCKVRSKYIVNTMLCPNCGARMDGGDSDVLNQC